MSLDVQITNYLSKIFVASLFRKNYSPQTMRRHMKIISSVPRAILKRSHPAASFEEMNMDGVPAEMISARKGQEKIILFLHGGGYFMGSISGFRRFALSASRQCDSRVVLIDYRLAPEHPYPAALDDAKKAFLYLRAKFPGVEISVGGDSAGGGLALALVMALRDGSHSIPDKVFAVSPWADLVGEGESLAKNQKLDFWLNKEMTQTWGAHYYVQNDPKTPYISPVFGSYAKFPPLLIFVGDQEILMSDSERVFSKAKAAGVQTQLHIGKGMQHDWFLAFPSLSESKRAVQTLKDFMSKDQSI